MEILTKNPEDTAVLASLLGLHLKPGMIIFLEGDLGTGKTTFVQSVISSLGYKESINSPTYTLVEPYEFNNYTIYHFDLYRIENEQELEDIGIRDYLDGNAICFFEWPQRAPNILKHFDIKISFEFKNELEDDFLRSITFHADKEDMAKIVHQISLDIDQ